MIGLIQDFFTQDVEWRDSADIMAAGRRIENQAQRLGILVELFGHETGPWKGTTGNARKILKRHARGLMRRFPVTIVDHATLFEEALGSSEMQTTKSIYSRLTDVIATLHDRRMIASLKTPALILLGIPLPTAVGEYLYEIHVRGTGVAGDVGPMGLGAFQGDFHVTRLGLTKKTFTFHFLWLSGSGGVSVGARFAIDMKGTARSVSEWQKEDFVGGFSSYDSSDNIGLIKGKSMGFSEWVLKGKPGAPMTVSFHTTMTVAIEAGKEVGGGKGWIVLRDDDVDPDDLFVAPKPLQHDYLLKYNAQVDAQFESGSAALSSQGRDVIGWMAASELALLHNPRTTLKFIGSADRVDTKWFNQLLSERRAANAEQALKDTLGAQLKALTSSHGVGEHVAALMGDPDGTDNAEWRRVFVEVDGYTLATLVGARSKGGKKGGR